MLGLKAKYDALGRKIAETNAEGGVTRSTYDSVGRLKSLTDPAGNTTSWTYNFIGRVAAEHVTVDNVLHTRKFLYDAAGNIVRKIDRNGRVTEWTFDKLNRHTSETWFENDAQKKQFVTSYTRSGKIASMGDGENKFEFVYDIFGNESKQTQKLAGLEKTVEFRTVSDIAGQKTESSLSLDGAADYTNTYTYNTLGKISSIAQQSSSSKKVTMGYDVYGQIALQTRFQNDKEIAVTKNTYDSLGRITGINHSSHNDKTLADYHYKWDAANRITEINDDKYGYDKTNQLLSAVYAKKPKEQYAYDLNGNRLTALLQGQEKKYETGNFNRLLSENGEKLEYDAEGNRTAKGNIKYEWDHRNRLVKVVSPSETVEYTYDYQNRLVKRSIGKNITHFIHDGWQIVRQFENGKPVKRFLWGTKQDELLCDNDNWTLGDHLNTIREVVNSDGKVIAHCDYNAFGKCLSPLNGLSFAYTGKMTDSATNLQWNINRWYDSSVGRWISEDPIGFGGKDVNLARYVGNHVLSLIDYHGLWKSNVHRGKTFDWCGSVVTPKGFKLVACDAIADADAATDGVYNGPWPAWLIGVGNQAYHFNRNFLFGGDSRIDMRNARFAQARNECSKLPASTRDPNVAAGHIGVGLHALQDYYAHGDYGRPELVITTVHNTWGPYLSGATGIPANYPDDITLDAIGGVVGRPAGTGIKYTTVTNHVTGEISTYDYAEYEFGTKRIAATESATKLDLSQFYQYLKSNPMLCECRRFFLQ